MPGHSVNVRVLDEDAQQTVVARVDNDSDGVAFQNLLERGMKERISTLDKRDHRLLHQPLHSFCGRAFIVDLQHAPIAYVRYRGHAITQPRKHCWTRPANRRLRTGCMVVPQHNRFALHTWFANRKSAVTKPCKFNSSTLKYLQESWNDRANSMPALLCWLTGGPQSLTNATHSSSPRSVPLPEASVAQ